jgi:hypothetical protein
MDLEQQLRLIREEKHLAYNRYLLSKKSDVNHDTQNGKARENREKKINSLLKIHRIYNEMTNPKIVAAKKIQRFIREKYFLPNCVNEDDIAAIPPLYRLRITITNHHAYEYSERDIEADMIDTHRIIHNTIVVPMEKYILFRYCFDIRDLYLQKDNIIEVYGTFFFMQPDDHIRINNLWNKVNGTTNNSIAYVQQFEYWKSLSIDSKENDENKEKSSEKVRKEIEKIVEEDDNSLEKYNSVNQQKIYWS